MQLQPATTTSTIEYHQHNPNPNRFIRAVRYDDTYDTKSLMMPTS